MVNATLSIDVEQWADLERLLTEFPRQADRAIMRAVNRAGKMAWTRALRAVTRETGLKRKDIAGKRHRFGGVLLHKAKRRFGTLQARVEIMGKRVPVFMFKPRPKLPRRAGEKLRRKGASWKIGKSPRQYAAPPYRAFVAKMAHSGHVGVFRRISAKPLKVIELKGPSLPFVAQRSVALLTALDGEVRETLHKRLASQLGLLLSKRAKRGGGTRGPRNVA